MCQFAFQVCNGYIRYMNVDKKRQIIDQFSGRTRMYTSGGVYNAVTSRQLGMVADAVTAAEWDEWVENIRAGESAIRDLRLRIEALRDNNGLLPECEQCGDEFTGRSDARYCSTRCRVAAHRAKPKATDAEKQERADDEDRAGRLAYLNGYYEDTKLVSLTAPAVSPKERKKMVGWMRDAIEDIEALDG